MYGLWEAIGRCKADETWQYPVIVDQQKCRFSLPEKRRESKGDQMVGEQEHVLDMVGVVGSNPIAPTNKSKTYNASAATRGKTLAMLWQCTVVALLSGCTDIPREEYVWQGLHLVDTAQTVQIARSECFHEDGFITEQLIGENPSVAGAITWGVGAAAAHLGVSLWLKDHGPHWVYVAWQSVTITRSAYYVTDNHNKGIGVTGSDC